MRSSARDLYNAAMGDDLDYEHVAPCPMLDADGKECTCRRIAIQERFYKVGDSVYREWSYDGKVWCVEKTAYTNPPWTILDLSKIPTCVR